jgi:hypothetical protein
METIMVISPPRISAQSSDTDLSTNTVLHMPVEPIDEAMKRAIKADGRSVHNIALNHLDSIFNALFLICGTDGQLIRALDAGYCFLIDETRYERATVCGIGVGVAINIIGSLLAHGPDATSGASSPSDAKIRAEIANKFPDAVKNLFGLEIERKGLSTKAAVNSEAATAPDNNAGEAEFLGATQSWTLEEIQTAELGTVMQAAEFGTEFMQALDINRFDYEIDGCLLPAFNAYIESAESGTCTPEGSFLLAMRKIAHNLPISYGRGPVPDPRPSEVIRKEIESRSHYISALQDELEMALSEEPEKVKPEFDGGLDGDGG